jgi:hypothetical protein
MRTLRECMTSWKECFILQFESIHQGVDQAKEVVEPLT